MVKYMLRELLQSLQNRLCPLNAYVSTFARPTISIDNTACATSFMFAERRDARLELPSQLRPGLPTWM